MKLYIIGINKYSNLIFAVVISVSLFLIFLRSKKKLSYSKKFQLLERAETYEQKAEVRF